MRILLVSHPPLAAEAGAAQIATSLAAALAARGHDAQAWSPEPLPPDTRWWNLWRRQRDAAERFAAAAGPFDVIDTPALTASAELARHCRRLVVRSVQPELLYHLRDHLADLRRPSPRALANLLVGFRRMAAVVAGWRRARRILCLGTLERAWMTRRFPGWAGKLGLYFAAPPEADQQALASVRAARAARPPRRDGQGEPLATRFLWIGRWSAQKGTRRLLRFLRERAAAAPADRLTVAGCGAAALREIPPRWLAQGRVALVPTFAHEELPALLAAHDAGLFTSAVEGWGLALNEMLESGLPVYATEAGAVPDLRPFLPASLRAFPPPPRVEPAPGWDAATARRYYEVFSWRAIAAEYERQVAP